MKTTSVLTLTLAASALLALAPVAAHAFQAGNQVTGTLKFGSGSTNYFDPANGFVPAGSGYSNTAGATVAISNTATEFGFVESDVNTDTANFTTPTVLTIQDVVQNTASAFQMTFTAKTAGDFNSLSLVSSNFPGTFTYGAANDVITVNWGGTNTGGTYTAVFAVGVPEPSTYALALLGGAGLLGGVVRQRRATRLRV